MYPSCIQATVTLSGSQVLPSSVVFPGAYTDSTPGIKSNLYNGTSPTIYVAPGPAVWSGIAGGSIGQIRTAGQRPVSGATGTPGSVFPSASSSTAVTSVKTTITSSAVITSVAATTSIPVTHWRHAKVLWDTEVTEYVEIMPYFVINL